MTPTATELCWEPDVFISAHALVWFSWSSVHRLLDLPLSAALSLVGRPATIAILLQPAVSDMAPHISERVCFAMADRSGEHPTTACRSAGTNQRGAASQ